MFENRLQFKTVSSMLAGALHEQMSNSQRVLYKTVTLFAFKQKLWNLITKLTKLEQIHISITNKRSFKTLWKEVMSKNSSSNKHKGNMFLACVFYILTFLTRKSYGIYSFRNYFSLKTNGKKSFNLHWKSVDWFL